MTVAETDPEQARAYLRESRELHGARQPAGPRPAAGMAFFLNNRTATLELGHSAIPAVQRGGDHLLMGFVLHIIAGALVASQPEAAAMIQGAAKAYVGESPTIARLIS